jgi:hypothetical protein
MSAYHEVTDYLQNRDVFVNGFSGKPAHMYSYLTVIDYDAIDKALKESPFTTEQLKEVSEEYENDHYLTPIAKLTSNIINRFLKKE